MSRTIVIRLSAAILLFAGCWVAYSQNQKQAPNLTVNKVKDDLFEIEGDGGNVAVYVTGDGLILVDDKYDLDHDQIMDKIKSISNQPVKYILSTHYHEDHSGGNTKFLPTAEVISTVNAHINIVEHKQSNAAPGVSAARVTFSQEAVLFLGGKQVRSRYFGRGHTNGDAFVLFPAQRTLHTGDMMAGTSPLIDYPGGGSLVEWTNTLDEVLKMDFDTVIPGHGAVTNKAGLKTYRDNVEKLRNRAQQLIRSGGSQDDLAKVMTAEYGWQPGSLNFQWSLPGMMTELR